MDWLVKAKHRTGKVRSKKETEFHYIVKEFKNKYNNKLFPRLTHRKECKGVVGSGKDKVLVQMFEYHKGSYKEIRCVDCPNPIWNMGLVYCVEYASLIIEVGPLLVDSLLE